MIKSGQQVMHCRCGRSKILAHGMCGVCYTLKRQDEEYSEVCVRRFWNATGIAVACAMPRAAISDPSSFTIAFQGSRSSAS